MSYMNSRLDKLHTLSISKKNGTNISQRKRLKLKTSSTQCLLDMKKKSDTGNVRYTMAITPLC